VIVDGKRYRTCTSAADIRDAESMTSSWNDRERGQRNHGSIGLAASSINQKNRRFRVAVIKRYVWRMLPLGYQDHMASVVDIIKGAMGLYKVRLFYDQRAENAITDIGA
jgi:hypothetical protein